MVLEDDDFWPPEKLEKQLSAFDELENVLSWGRVAIVNSKGKIVGAILSKNFTNRMTKLTYHNKPKRRRLKKLLF